MRVMQLNFLFHFKMRQKELGVELEQTEKRRVRSSGLERTLKSRNATIMPSSPSQLLVQIWAVKGREGNVTRFTMLFDCRAGPTK